MRTGLDCTETVFGTVSNSDWPSYMLAGVVVGIKEQQTPIELLLLLLLPLLRGDNTLSAVGR